MPCLSSSFPFFLGVLKITPAHDFTDFAIARNHADQLSDEDCSRFCIDESGCLINAADLNGIDRFEARNKVILFFMGLLQTLEKDD